MAVDIRVKRASSIPNPKSAIRNQQSEIPTVAQPVFIEQLDNGLVLLAEPMDWLQSTAFNIVIPGGCSLDPVELLGLSNFTCEMVQRGCGERDSRQFVEDLENLGVVQGASVSGMFSSFYGAMPSSQLAESLPIFADLVRRPLLPADQLDDGRLVCLQEIQSSEDDLAQRVMNELRTRHYPAPLGRVSHGTIDAVTQISLDQIRSHFSRTYRPNGTILAVAGNIDWPRLRDQVGELFGDWPPVALADVRTTPAGRGYHHIEHDSNQTHLGVSFPSVPYSHVNYFQARGAVGVLSDGMSSRLFTEVREKRSLCYTVFASLSSLKDEACIVSYAGTSTERAQETLDVLIGELRRMTEGIREDELGRLKALIRSALIIEQESSRSRASSIAGDWYHLGRVRSLDEVSEIVNNLTVDSINTYLSANPPKDFSIVTLGENKLEVPSGVS